MAITVTQPQRNDISGSRITAFLDVQLDNSYPTGGYALDLNSYVNNIDTISIHVVPDDGAFGAINESLVVEYQPAAAVGSRKIKCFGRTLAVVDDQSTPVGAPVAGTLGEVNNSTDLSGVRIQITITGRR